ncbi:MAG TPA: DNA-binding protein [Nitrospiraceae bacterium]|nr:DNA-binding protein [Nitrospiraceae bacterium]
MNEIIPQDVIEQKIFLIKGQKVMLDRDLAVLYGVETKILNKAVRRNIERFPRDFMFQLTKDEFDNLKFQFGTSSWGGTRKLPLVFTENGVAMLSSVLNSKRAIQVNIQIMRTFTKIRTMLASNAQLARKLKALEKKYDEQFAVVFEAIYKLMAPPEKEQRKIGFKREKG